MKTPKRIQRRRTKGWKKPPNTVDITLNSKWGNPFVIGKDGDRHEDCEKYKKLMLTYRNHFCRIIVSELKGKNLMCYCKLDEECHGDFLLKIANDKSLQRSLDYLK